MKKLTNIALGTLLGLYSTCNLIAQSENTEPKKVKIHVVVNENGVEKEIEKEITIDENQDWTELLKEIEGFESFDFNGVTSENVNVVVKSNVSTDGKSTTIYNHTTCDELSKKMETVTRPFLGIQGYTTHLHDSGKQQVRITKVIENSAASQAGLLSEDIIVSANGQALTNYKQLVEIIVSQEKGDKLDLVVNRNGKKLKLTATLGEKEFNVCRVGTGSHHGNIEIDVMKIYSQVSSKEKIMLGQSLGLSTQNDFNDVDIEIFPNPSSGSYKYNLNLDKGGTLDLLVMDVNGKIIISEELKNSNGSYQGEIDLANYNNGSYFVIFKRDDKTLIEKLVKQ